MQICNSFNEEMRAKCHVLEKDGNYNDIID